MESCLIKIVSLKMVPYFVLCSLLGVINSGIKKLVKIFKDEEFYKLSQNVLQVLTNGSNAFAQLSAEYDDVKNITKR